MCDWSERYGDNWQKLAHLTKKLTDHHCVICRRPHHYLEAHHALYRDKDGFIVGREKPGVHIFPLCKTCHQLAHNQIYWIKDHLNPLQNNRNTHRFYLQLRRGWQQLKQYEAPQTISRKLGGDRPTN